MSRIELLLDDAAIAIRTIRTVQVRASEMLKLYPNSEKLQKLARSLVVEGPTCTCGEPVVGPSPWTCPGCRQVISWSVETRQITPEVIAYRAAQRAFEHVAPETIRELLRTTEAGPVYEAGWDALFTRFGERTSEYLASDARS